MPAARTWSSIAVCAPDPSAIIVITAATPIVIPSIVSVVCSLLRPSARQATSRLVRSISGLLHREGARPVDVIGDDVAVLEPDDARGVLGDLLLVRDQHDGDPALLLEPLEDVHHL